MTGLLTEIGGLRARLDISADISVQGEALGAVIALVERLRSGPPELAALNGLVAALPLPPALPALTGLAAALPEVMGRAPAAPEALLEPLLAPLRDLAEGGFSVSVRFDIAAVVEVVQEVLRLASGRVVGGPQGMPGGPDGGPVAFTPPDPVEMATLREAMTGARSALAALGPRLDARRLLEMLQDAAGKAGPLHAHMPPIPVLGDLMEALATLAAWQVMTPEALARSLAATLEDAARVMAAPRHEVADPLLAAATAATGAGAAFTQAAERLEAVLPGLAARLATGLSRPTASEALALERLAEALDPVLAALDPRASPLAQVEDLPFHLTGALLRAQRALSPGGDGGALLERLRGWIAGLPAPEPAPLGPLVTKVTELDLAALAGPAAALRDAVEAALAAMDSAQAGVRAGLEAAMEPLLTGLEAALGTALPEAAIPALSGLADQLSGAIEGTIAPAVAGVAAAIEAAVAAVDAAGGAFDPAALVAPLAEALDQLAALLEDPTLQQGFAALAEALQAAADALDGLDLAAAADAAIANIEGIEARVATLDPVTIPAPAKPLVEQAVKLVVDIDFAAEAGKPLQAGLQRALAEGPGALLAEVERGVDALRTELDGFRPSAAIGPALAAPFRELSATLRGFRPSALLGEVQGALDAVAAQAGVLDPAALLAPLRAAHAALAALLARLDPAVLLAPVRAAADAALRRMQAEIGLDRAFAGFAELAVALEGPLELIADARDLLREGAALLAEPGDARAQVAALLDGAIARLGTVEMARLAEGFAATAAAHEAIQRAALVVPLAPALRAAATAAPVALAGPGVRLARALAALPEGAFRLARPGPATRRAAAAVERLATQGKALEAAREAWPALGQRLAVQAGGLEARLADYQRLLLVEGGGAFAGLTEAVPPTREALQAAVRAALEEEVAAPLGVLQQALLALAPWVAGLAASLSDLLDAITLKLDAVLGEEGLGGAATGLVEIGERLSRLDLGAVEGPLGALHARLAAVVAALDPDPLEPSLRAAAEALSGLLRAETLIPPASLAAADASWAAAVARIEALSPEAVLGATLDPAFDRALGALAPVLDIPPRLRAILDAAGGNLTADVELQIGRVEAAFDRMVLALPARLGVADSVRVSVRVGVG